MPEKEGVTPQDNLHFQEKSPLKMRRWPPDSTLNVALQCHAIRADGTLLDEC